MIEKGVSQNLLEEGERTLERYELGEIDFMDHEWRFAHFGAVDFTEWARDWIKTKTEIETSLPGLDSSRVQHLLKTPEDATAVELRIWAENVFSKTEPPSGATLYVFIPIATIGGETGIAVVRDYGDIPGGEYDLFGVFESQQAADDSLKGTLWYEC